MFKNIIPALFLCAATVAVAENPTIMKVELKNGQSSEFTISDIDKITFVEEQGPAPEATEFSFTIPTSFTSSYVQKVMYNGKQVAEIDLEYIKSLNKQVTVIYPCDENGKADLTKGVTTTGASVVWDLTANTATVGEEGTEAATKAFLANGAITFSYEGETATAAVEPDVIVDIRGSQTETYTITKIGVQYWMAQNLRATNFADGSPIAAISETEASTTWSANTTGAYLIDSNADWVKLAGLLYNGFVVTNEKGIAPVGWEVPTQEQLTKLRSAGNLKAANFRDTNLMSWAEGTVCNNMTGFSAVATGTFTPATGVSSMFTDTYFWSSTKYYDALSKGDNLDTLRVTAGATSNVVVSSSMLGGHSLQMGHAIRCIRK